MLRVPNLVLKMETDQADVKLNTVTLIGDAIDFICQKLEMKDLHNVAQVCKSWNDAARREKLKRLHIQLFRLPYDFKDMVFKLDVNRSTALLICDLNFQNSKRNMYLEDADQTEDQLLKLLKEKQVQKTIVLLVDDYLTTDEVTIEGARHQSEFLGFFFPNMEQRTRVRMACIQNFNPKDIDMQVDRFGEELGFDDCDFPKSTLLLFCNRQNRHTDKFVNKLRKRIHSGEQMTWIGIFGERVIVTNCVVEDLYKPILSQEFVAIRITGPSVESWSTFIHCLERNKMIEYKLDILKQKVKSKSHYIGLIYSPKCSEKGCTHVKHTCCNSHEIMRCLKLFFPDIPFVGFFQNTNLRGLTARSNSFGKDNGYYLFMYTSIIIISYN